MGNNLAFCPDDSFAALWGYDSVAARDGRLIKMRLS